MPPSRADARFHQDSIKKRDVKGGLYLNLGKSEGKAASLSQASAFYPDISTHRLGQRACDGETDAGAAESARTRLVDAVEAFEKVRTLLRGETDARIGDAEGHPAFLAAYHYFHATRSRSVAQRVDQQIREDLHSAGRVGQNARKVLGHMDLQFKPFFGKLPFKRLKRALDEVLWGNRVWRERNLACLSPRQFLQIVHQ